MAAVRGLDPWAIQKSSDGSIGISAEDARASVGALWAQSGPEKTYSGVVPQGTDPATGTPAGLIVRVTNPVSMQLNVSPGQFVVQSDTAGTPYSGAFRGTSTITVPPSDSAHSRVDLVIAYVSDSDAGVGSGKGSFLDVLPGTADGTNTLPDVPDGATAIAGVNVAAGATAISAVTDTRAFVVAVGGMRPVVNGVGIDEPGYPGQPRTTLDTATGAFSLDLYTPTGEWQPIASKLQSYTPTVSSTNYPSITLGTGGTVTGYYQRFIGGLVYVYVQFDMGTTTGDAGYGPLTFSLPPGIAPLLPQVYLPARVQNKYWLSPGLAYLSSGTNAVQVACVVNNQVSSPMGFVENADTSWQPGTGVPHVDGHFSVQGDPSVAFNIEFNGLFIASS